jgi:hypothetical protein
MVGEHSLSAKFKPAMVTGVLPETAPFTTPPSNDTPGLSKVKADGAVPTTPAAVTANP